MKSNNMCTVLIYESWKFQYLLNPKLAVYININMSSKIEFIIRSGHILKKVAWDYSEIREVATVHNSVTMCPNTRWRHGIIG